MTSTSFNVGLTANTKNSSRVIKPPGGGHTDIFGVNSNGNDIVTPSKRKNVPASTITSCFGEETPEKMSPKKIDEKKNPEQRNGNSQEVNGRKDENTEPQIDINKETDENVVLSRRQRVPPGGFSSGFW